MDDIIVIILTLLVVVVGAINQFRKKQKQPIPENVEEKEPSGLSFWEELLEVKKEEVLQHEIIGFENTIKTEESKKVIPQPIIPPDKNEGAQVMKSNYHRNIIKDSEIGLKNRGANLPKGFSLRRAIIFSEIIQHKYF